MSDLDSPQGERLHYSGMTHANTLDGTTATEAGREGPAPTGHEKIDARAILGADDGSGMDLLHRMQPGIAASDGVGAGREKAEKVKFALPRRHPKQPAAANEDPANHDSDDEEFER